MAKDETKYYMQGAEYFEKDYSKLTNKKQYKKLECLNTGLWYFRNNGNIKIFTSCIACTSYLYTVITKKSKNVEIYYFETRVNIEELKKYYIDKNVKFIKLAKNPKDEFSSDKHTRNTMVFASNDTIIFDEKQLGIKEFNGPTREFRHESRKAYRDKSKFDYKKYLEQAMNLV